MEEMEWMEVMIHPTIVVTSYCFGDVDVFMVMSMDNDIVDQMPLLGLGVFPRCLVLVVCAEYGFCDD